MDDEQRRLLLMLHELCADGAPVTLMSRDLLAAHYGRFTAIEDNAVVLEFPRQPPTLAFQPPALCVASMAMGGRTCLFTTRIKHSLGETADRPARVIIEVPAAVRRAEARMAFRVLVRPSAPLRTTVDNGTGPIPVRAIDLSLCGMLIEVDGALASTLAYDHRVTVSMQLGQDAVQLRAAVRRVDPPRIGIYFPDTVVAGRLEPPAPLRRIVEWLQASSH